MAYGASLSYMRPTVSTGMAVCQPMVDTCDWHGGSAATHPTRTAPVPGGTRRQGRTPLHAAGAGGRQEGGREVLVTPATT